MANRSKQCSLLALGLLAISLNILNSSSALAQGQDSTTAERDRLILAELLPGLYNNANQVYFDVRLKVEETQRHSYHSLEISRLKNSDFKNISFLVAEADSDKAPKRNSVISLSVDEAQNAVRMKTYRLNGKPRRSNATYAKGCDLFWRQEAGQFRGRSIEKGCAKETAIARDMMLSKDALWFSLSDQLNGPVDDHFALDRARVFSCYADLPGVGGGRDIPFKRYQINDIHDLGGEKWFTTDQGQEIGINLFRVMWTFNNLNGVFTRPSLVVYIKTKEAGAQAKEISYAWTEPRAQRIGINLKWMLVNCYMISNEDIVPFYKTDEPRV